LIVAFTSSTADGDVVEVAEALLVAAAAAVTIPLLPIATVEPVLLSPRRIRSSAMPATVPRSIRAVARPLTALAVEPVLA
jgi:hypothetical protein